MSWLFPPQRAYEVRRRLRSLRRRRTTGRSASVRPRPNVCAQELGRFGDSCVDGLLVGLSSFHEARGQLHGNESGPKQDVQRHGYVRANHDRNERQRDPDRTGTKESATATAALTGTTKTTSQILCESYGGTFTLAPLPNNLWSCTGWSYTTSNDFGTKADALTSTCLADGGNGSSAGGSDGVANFFCQRNPRTVPAQ